jgi:hypothetical protein|tara:strand:+ start:186 stop:404 length:219 start_codon:yes stop_codon:yes gene_type:complete
MKKRNKRFTGLYRLTKLEPLTYYDVIAITKNDEIQKIGTVNTREQAIELKSKYFREDVKYYMLENATVLQQL